MNRLPITRRSSLRSVMPGSIDPLGLTVPPPVAVPVRSSPHVPRLRSSPAFTADSALTRLMAGNARFVAGDTQFPRRAIDRWRQRGSRPPFAAVLGCSDAGIPPEVVFDEGFGDLFSVRVAGNVATTDQIASLEYAVSVLGSKLVLVLGHTDSRVVRSAVDGEPLPDHVAELLRHVAPMRAEGASIDSVVVENVRHQARFIRLASKVIRAAERSGVIEVRGAVFRASDGRVRLVD